MKYWVSLRNRRSTWRQVHEPCAAAGHCQHTEFHPSSCSVQVLVSAVAAGWPNPNLSLIGLSFEKQKLISPPVAQDNKKWSKSSTPTNWVFSTELLSEIWIMSDPPALSCLPEDSDRLGHSFTVCSPCQNIPAVPPSTLSHSHLHPGMGAWLPQGCSVQECVSSSSSPDRSLAQPEVSVIGEDTSSKAPVWAQAGSALCCCQAGDGAAAKRQGVRVSGCCWEWWGGMENECQ